MHKKGGDGIVKTMNYKMMSLWLCLCMILSTIGPQTLYATEYTSEEAVIHTLAEENTITTSGTLNIEERLSETKENALRCISENSKFTQAYESGSKKDWYALALGRSDRGITSDYAESIKNFMGQFETPAQLEEELGSTTEFERITIGLTAAGYDASQVMGHNLVEHIYNAENLEDELANTYIFALLALDSKPYDIPADAHYTRQQFIDLLLRAQEVDGGFGYGWGGDVDLTAMAIQCLAPYKNQANVQKAIELAINWLSSQQQANGGYQSWGSYSCESVAQVICALVSIDEDPATAEDFKKPEGDLLTHLLRYYDETTGGFKHTEDGDVDLDFATPQAAYTLVAYSRFKEGKNRLYDMSDITHFNILKKDEPQKEMNWLTAKEGTLTYLAQDTNYDVAYKKGDARDWITLTLARDGKSVPTSYGDRIGEYLLTFKPEEIEEKITSVTEFARMTMGLTAAGYDATNISGHDLVAHIYNNKNLAKQGIYAMTYGLLAMDTKPYQVPEGALYTRDKIISLIKDWQAEDGSFSYQAKKGGDIDTTAMVVQGLAPYKNRAEVKEVIDKALNWLSNQQLVNGGYESWGTECSESTAQVICALTSLGKDPVKEVAFVKAEGNLLTNLTKYYDETTGGFKHVQTGASSLFSTYQVGYALVSYARYLNGQTTLYDMSDCKVYKTIGEIQHYKISDSKEPITLKINQEKGNIDIWQASNKQDVTLELAACKQALPHIHISQDKVEVQILKGTKIESSTTQIALPKVQEDKDIVAKIQKVIGSQKIVSNVTNHIQVGSQMQSITFNQKVKLIFKNEAGSEVAYQDHLGKIYPITKVKAQADKSKYNEVCYEQGEDLIVETNHFTGFIVYTTKAGGGKEPDYNQNQYINISVEARTIGKGDLYMGEIIYKEGDTVYDILAKTGLNLEGDRWYVSGINGYREKEHGKGSGWMVTVNGKFIDVSAGVYKVKPGDNIRWQYTTNLGKDLGANFVGESFFNVDTYSTIDIKVALNKIIEALKSEKELSDWEAFGLIRAGEKVPESYQKALIERAKKNQGKFRKITEVERLMIVLSSLGVDCTNVAGYNLAESIYNAEDITIQGNNGVIFALIALDTKDYKVPDDVKWTREKMKNILLEAQNSDGGFPLMEKEASDIDITAMAIQALAPYKNEQKVKECIDKAIDFLSLKQQANGHYVAYGTENSESLSQVIIALTSLGIDPTTDTRFIKEEKTLIDALTDYRLEDGHFSHKKSGEADSIATEQALMALISYDRLKNEKASLYHLSEISISKVVEEKKVETVAEKEVATPKAIDLGKYKDVQQISTWAKEDLQEAVTLGIISGCEDYLKPQDQVTRAEFASMLVRMLNSKEEEISTSLQFKDVTNTDWYAKDVVTAYNQGLIKGVTADKFGPKEKMTREQLAAILVRLVEPKTKANQNHFKDEQAISTWAIEAVNTAYDEAILKGYDNGTFRPKETVTREVAAITLLRIKKNLEQKVS